MSNGKSLTAEVKATLQLLIDADIRAGGVVTEGTLEAIAVQGYAYQCGRLTKLTDLQKRAVEIAKKYEALSTPDKIGIIAKSFGCVSGKIETSPCTGKWFGTSDVSIRFDNGAALFIGNDRTPQAKAANVQRKLVNATFQRYNPEIVAATKETALASLRAREALDNAIAAKKGLKPYTLLNVEFCDGMHDESSLYIGWYYVTLAVDGKIRAHLETGLKYDIADGQVSDSPTRERYFVAGGLKEAWVDYVFNNVGFSSNSTLYTTPMSHDVLERAKKTLSEQVKAQAKAPAFHTAPRRRPSHSKPRRTGLGR